MAQVAEWFDDAVRSADDDARLAAIAGDVKRFLREFPAPGIAI